MNPWVPSPAWHKPVVVDTQNPSTVIGRPRVQGHLWLQSEFKASLDYLRLSKRKDVTEDKSADDESPQEGTSQGVLGNRN